MLTKTLTIILHLNRRLFFYWMDEGTFFTHYLLRVKDIIYYLESMEVSYDEEYFLWIFMCSLPFSHANFRDAILCSCNTLTLNEENHNLLCKKKIKDITSETEGLVEGILAQRRTLENKINGDWRSTQSELRSKYKICNYFKKGCNKFC